MQIKPLLRAAQSRMPWVRPAKFGTYNLATRLLGWPIEPEFRLLSRLGPISMALDIGANWGQSIHGYKHVLPATQIISFEPFPYLAQRLTRQFSDDRNVTVQPFALSDAAGRFTLYVPHYHGYIYDSLASLSQAEARDWFTPERFANFNPRHLRIEEIEVEARTLDSFTLAPQVIKIDVQGLEAQVVRGGMQTFAQHRPVTIMENPSPELVDLMAELGLIAYFFDGRSLSDWREHTNNVLFLSDDHRRSIQL